MFAPCPHCGYLMALIATSDAAPRECPRCHRMVDTHVTPPVRSVPVAPAATPARPQASPAGPLPVRIATPDVAAANAASDTPDAAVPSPARTDPAPAQRDAAIDAEAAHDAKAHAAATLHVQRIDANVPPRAADPVPAMPTAPAATATSAPRGAHSPSFARRHRTTALPDRPLWPWRVGALVLALLLALQLLLSQRDVLAQDPRWRPVLARACGIGLCTLPPGRDAAAFEMVARSVRPLPGTGELAVDARFRNAAPWPQAWPHLQLVLSDAQGRPAAARVFAPADYAGDTARRAIAPGQTVHARMRVVEPQPATVAFAFDFR